MKICGKGSRGPLCIVKASNKRRRYVGIYMYKTTNKIIYNCLLLGKQCNK